MTGIEPAPSTERRKPRKIRLQYPGWSLLFLLSLIAVLSFPVSTDGVTHAGKEFASSVHQKPTPLPATEQGPVAPCRGVFGPDPLTGNVSVMGGPNPPSPSGWPVSYEATVGVVETKGSDQQTECYDSTTGPVGAQGQTATTATYSIEYQIPTGPCPSGYTCKFFGPLAPYNPVLGSVPSGYVEDFTSGGIDVCYALGEVNVSSGSTAYGTPGGPLALTVVAQDACGVPTQATSVIFNWRFTSSENGWSFGGATSATGSAVTLDASPTAGSATIAVQATGTYHGSTENSVPSYVQLKAIPTGAGTLTAPSLANDSGISNPFFVSNVIAAQGYSYSCLLWPLGSGTAVRSPCHLTLIGNGEVSISARFNATFWDNGTSSLSYLPVAEVSNGYSTSPPMDLTSRFTVYPAPELHILGLPEDLYLGAQQHLNLSVSGGLPGYVYCFSPANSTPATCTARTTTDPYLETLSYPAVGTYEVTSSSTDWAGVETTATAIERVWNTMQIESAGVTLPTVDLGHSTTVFVNVNGGALPLEVWWNSSANPAQGLCAPSVAVADGNLSCAFTPDWEGTRNVTITVVDAGTQRYTTFIPIQVDSPPGSLLLVGKAGNDTVTQNGTLYDEPGVPTDLGSTFAGGSGQFTYSWLVNGTPIAQGSGTARSFNYTWVPSGTGSFRISFVTNDTQGFSVSASFEVVLVPSLGNLSIAAQYDPVDPGARDTLSALFSGGIAPIEFTWNTGDGHTYLTRTPTLLYSWDVSSNYTVTVTAIDSIGVTRSYALNIEVVLPLAVPCAPASTEQPTEVGVPTLFSLDCITGGIQPYTLDWVFGDNGTFSGGPSSATYTYGTPGNVTVYVRVRDAAGGYAVSSGLALEVVPRLSVTIPKLGSPGCVPGANRNPTDAGLLVPLCAVPQSGVGPFTTSWEVGNFSLPGQNVTFPAPGNYTVEVVLTDHLGANASALQVFNVVAAPRLVISSATPRLDVNQTLRLRAQTLGGLGAASAWTITWRLSGGYVGSGLDLNYTFNGGQGAATPGNYTFQAQAIDLAGGRATSAVNVTLLPDPMPKLTLSANGSIDVDTSEFATATVMGGAPPYAFYWTVRTPVGWVNQTTSTANLTLPSSVEGQYELSLVASDSLGYDSVPAIAPYTVDGSLLAGLTTSAVATSNATVTGENVTILICRQSGGTAPFQYTINPSGTSPLTWQPLPSNSSCGSLNASYPQAGEYWITGEIRDGVGNTYSSLISLLVLPRASAPEFPVGGVKVAVHSHFYLTPSDSNPNASMAWTLPNPADVASTEYPNGTLELIPWLPGNYAISAMAEVTYNDSVLQRSASSNFSLVAVAGPVSAVRVSLSGMSAVAGGTVNISLSATDRWGNHALDFSGPLTLFMNGSVQGTGLGGPYVNYSGVQALVSDQGHEVSVPALAWQNGNLNVSISQDTAGEVYYAIAGLPFPVENAYGSARWNGTVRWVPDFGHLVLSSPEGLFENRTVNDTDWRIADRFGNPVPGGFVYVNSTWGGYNTSTISPIFTYGAGTFVAVNYTVFGSEGGTVSVTSESGQALLPEIHVPPLPSPSKDNSASCGGSFGCSPFSGWMIAIPISVALLAAIVLLWMRRRTEDDGPEERSPASDAKEADEDDLETDARIQRGILEHLDRAGSDTIEGILAEIGETTLSKEALLAYLIRLKRDGAVTTRMDTTSDTAVFSVSDSERRRLHRGDAGEDERTVSGPVIDERAFEEATQHHRWETTETDDEPTSEEGEA